MSVYESYFLLYIINGRVCFSKFFGAFYLLIPIVCSRLPKGKGVFACNPGLLAGIHFFL